MCLTEIAQRMFVDGMCGRGHIGVAEARGVSESARGHFFLQVGGVEDAAQGFAEGARIVGADIEGGIASGFFEA